MLVPWIVLGKCGAFFFPVTKHEQFLDEIGTFVLLRVIFICVVNR